MMRAYSLLFAQPSNNVAPCKHVDAIAHKSLNLILFFGIAAQCPNSTLPACLTQGNVGPPDQETVFPAGG
jgi:hypothetical protein